MAKKNAIDLQKLGKKAAEAVASINVEAAAKKAVESVKAIDVDSVKEQAAKAGELIGGKAEEIRNSAMAMKEDIAKKLTELDRMLEQSVTDYNDAFTLMNDRGVQLFVERNRAVDTIGFAEVRSCGRRSAVQPVRVLALRRLHRYFCRRCCREVPAVRSGGRTESRDG